MNKKALKLSIITPVFNAENNIKNYLESIANQTFDDFELIIIDGKSTDQTIPIIQKTTKDIDCIKIFSEPDLGIYDAMNKGMQFASGEWLYFIGADDTFYNERTLQNISKKLDSESDLVYGNVMHMAKGKVLHGKIDIGYLFFTNICHQCVFYRRDFAQKIGAYNLQFKIYADWDYNIRCFSASKKIKYVEDIICNYSGTGFSSIHSDQYFLKNKYKILAQHTNKSLTSKIFTKCRYDFYHRAKSTTDGSLINRMFYLFLFTFHSIREKADI